jgi:pimeloyl-ACP methyl ester carboxylesterase
MKVVDRLSHYGLRARGARSRYVDTGGGRMHVYDVAGRGRLGPLVLLHGLNSAASDFALFIAMLQPHFRRIVAPDLPWHGRSGGPSAYAPPLLLCGVVEALQALVPEPALVYGNSLGGLTSIRVYWRIPHRVRGLYLSSPGGAHMSAPELQTFLERFRIRDAADALRFVDRLYAVRPPYWRLARRMVLARFRNPLVNDMIANIGVDQLLTPGEVSGIAVPTRLVWGQADHLQPQSQLDFFKRNRPETMRIDEPHEFGHSPYMDKPRAVAKDVFEFAQTLW